jgi:glutamyl-tRNA synthetase
VSQDIEALARKYALQNAVLHGGAANPKAILGKILGERADLRSKAKEITPLIEASVSAVNAMAAEAQRAELESMDASLLAPKKKAQRQGLKHLPGWDEVPTIVMRFAPNPNGPATLGHSRGMVVHAEYQRMYKELGKPFKMILRYDDTDPATKVPVLESYDAIREDFEWLGGRPDHVFKASERIDVYYEHAVNLIRAGGAYVCQCSQEKFKALKDAGEPCPHRAQDWISNMAGWLKMVDGTFKPGEAVLRVATDIAHPDPALRDWVAFRILTESHPVVGDKYRVWPLLDFESAIEDHLQGVTHIVRGKDLIDSERKQRYIYDRFGWTYPRTMHWGRVKVHEFGKVSKSLFIEGVKSGKYSGWDDIRLPTLAALRRRGFEAEALTRFWVAMGLSEKDIAASLDNLEAENKKLVEKGSDRFFFVADPIEVTIEGLPSEGVEGHAPLHPEAPERGTRRLRVGGESTNVVLVSAEDAQSLDAGAMIRLKDWGNLRWEGPGKARYDGNDFKAAQAAGASIIQWVPKDAAVTAPLELWMPEEPLRVIKGIVESQALSRIGAMVQFERVGFVRIERDAKGLRALYAHP